MVQYMGTKEAAVKLGVTAQTVASWCRKGLIEGAEQDGPGSPWRIPIDAKRPNFGKMRTIRR